MRVIDFEANGLTCTAGEKAIGWKADRTEGRDRAAGPRRPEGRRPGRTVPPARPSPAATSAPARQDVGTSYETVATVDLPAGLYALSGKASVYMREALGTRVVGDGLLPPAAEVRRPAPRPCRTSRTPRSPTTTTSARSLSVMGLAYVPAGQTDKLHLQCKDDGGVGGDLTTLNNVKVIAQAGRRLHRGRQLIDGRVDRRQRQPPVAEHERGRLRRQAVARQAADPDPLLGQPLHHRGLVRPGWEP